MIDFKALIRMETRGQVPTGAYPSATTSVAKTQVRNVAKLKGNFIERSFIVGSRQC